MTPKIAIEKSKNLLRVKSFAKAHGQNQVLRGLTWVNARLKKISESKFQKMSQL